MPTDKTRPIVEAATAFANDFIRPQSIDWERDGRVPRAAFTQAAKAGLCGVMVREDLGGGGLGCGAASTVLEILSRESGAFAFGLWVHNNVANAIARFGTPDQIDRYLPGLLRGERIGAFCLTEPAKGSDATAIETLATKKAGGWSLTGEKAWVTNGTDADVLLVYAQTQAGQGASGIAAFIADGTASGVAKGAPYGVPGVASFGLADIKFSECAVADEDLLLPAGEGFRTAMSGINQARAFVGSICNGMLWASLDVALEYAASRQIAGASVLSFQGIQWSLADVATDLEASRLLVSEAMRLADTGEPVAVAAAHAKKFSSRVTFEGISACMQVMGAAGLKPVFPLSRHLMTAKAMHFVDGTTEIQNAVIARALLKPFTAANRK